MIITQPVPGEYPAYYENYFPLLDKNKPVLEQMHEDGEKCAKIIAALPQQKWHYAYAEGKWTCLQVLQHIIDTERIFTYRALCIARGEKQSLPGFNENTYAATVEMKHKTAGLVSLEWTSVGRPHWRFTWDLPMRKRNALGMQTTVA